MTSQLRYQEKDEKIIKIMRRHWMFLAVPMIVFFILLVGVAVFYIGSAFYFPFVLEEPYLQPTLLATTVFLLFLWLFFFVTWTDYYLDVWIVTNKRILDAEQMGLFKREVSEFKIYRVQDVTVEITGILPTFLNYGNVHIQTASEKREFIFKQVPNPYKVKDLVLKLHSEAFQNNLREKL